MKTKLLLVFALFFWAHLPPISAQVVIQDDNTYDTTSQMLMANEMFESGEPFAEALGYNLDNLNPMILNVPDSLAYTLGIENYEYSRYNLGTLTGRSGMGLHMMWSPIVTANAAMQDASFDGSMTGGTPNGYKEDDMLRKMVMHFGTITHHTPPMHPFPQFADFYSGNNTLPQAATADFQTNWASLRWDRSQMDKTLNLSAMGQSMSKQYLWAQDMLSAFHDSNDNSITADGTVSPDLPNSPHFDPNNDIFYGGDGLDGFIGIMLTAVAINKTKFVISTLAYDGNNLSGINPSTYNPANGIKYFPHKIGVTEMPTITGLPPKADSFTVIDASSKLFDQVSFLTASLGFTDMMNPNNNSDPAHLAYHEVFDGDPFPAPMSVTGNPGPFDLMKGTSKVLFLNIMAMHFKPTEGTFVNTSQLNGGNISKGNKISAENATYAIVSMEKASMVFSGTPIQQAADASLIKQADFILQHFKDPNGGFYNSYDINSGPDTSSKTLAANAALTRALYVAYRATNNQAYLTAANEGYNFLLNNFYNPVNKSFLSDLGNTVAMYDAWNIAILSGALREANLIGTHPEAANIYVRFFKNIVNKMQLSEAEQTGETGNDSDADGIPYIVGGHKPFVMAHRATYDTTLSLSDEQILSFGVKVFPNPTTDFINISINNTLPNANLKINIFNLTGQEVYQNTRKLDEGKQQITLPIYLSRGHYILRASVNNDIVKASKLIIH